MHIDESLTDGALFIFSHKSVRRKVTNSTNFINRRIKMMTRRKFKLSELGIDNVPASGTPNNGRKRKSDPSSSAVKILKSDKSRPNGGKVSKRLISDHKSDHAHFNEMCKAIEHVYAKGYVDVVERLKLTCPVQCTKSLKECSTKHHRNRHIALSNNIIQSQTFLKNHQPSMFNHVVMMDVLEGKFPGYNAIHSLFELILCVNEPSNNVFDVKNVINMTASTLSSIIEKFPPCWLAANQQYRSLIQMKKKQLISNSNELLNTRTLFEDLIFCIEHVIQAPANRSAPVDDKLNNSLLNDSLFNDSMGMCFKTFESKTAQKYVFDDLPREEKIDRVFLALALFVQLFETDFAMWTIRNLRDPCAKIFDSRKGTLLGSILWSNDEPKQVNYFVKNILKLYTNYIRINFPERHTHILGRLVNLIYNMFDLYDFSVDKSDDVVLIKYPQSVEKQSYFCDAFTQIIYENSGCNVEQWLNVIQKVENPRMKLYLITALLTKIDHQKVTLVPETIHSSLYELEKQLLDDADSHINNNNVEKIKGSERRAGNDTKSKYPYLQKVNRRAASVLSIEWHSELLLVALSAYMNIFHTEEIHQYWQNLDRYETEMADELKRYGVDMKSVELEPVDSFDLNVMKKLQKKSLQDRIAAMEQDRIFNLDVLNRANGLNMLNEANDLQLKLQFDPKIYRNDAKYIDLITVSFPKLRSKFGALFPKSETAASK